MVISSLHFRNNSAPYVQSTALHGFPFHILRRVPYTNVYVQEDVTKAAVFMVATQLAKEPLVR